MNYYFHRPTPYFKSSFHSRNTIKGRELAYGKVVLDFLSKMIQGLFARSLRESTSAASKRTTRAIKLFGETSKSIDMTGFKLILAK
jgi:hypothetical protein